MLAEQIQRLRHQLGHAGFTVRAGRADQLQMVAWLTVKTPGNVRQLCGQTLDPESAAPSVIGSTVAPSTS